VQLQGFHSSTIIVDGSDTKGQLGTAKNHFSALGGNEDSDDDEKRHVKPAMVQKKKGEKINPNGEKIKDEGGSEEDEPEVDEEAKAADAEARRKRKAEEATKKAEGRKAAEVVEDAQEAAEVDEDLKIVPDPVAAKQKYEHRKKLEPKDLPREEMEAQKENKKPVQQKKKKNYVDEEEEYDKSKKLAVWED